MCLNSNCYNIFQGNYESLNQRKGLRIGEFEHTVEVGYSGKDFFENHTILSNKFSLISTLK